MIFSFVILERFETTCPKVCSSLPHNFSCTVCTSILCKTSASDRMWPRENDWSFGCGSSLGNRFFFQRSLAMKSHVLERTIPKWIWFIWSYFFPRSCMFQCISMVIEFETVKKMNCGTKKLSLGQRFVVRKSPPKSVGNKDGSKQLMFIHWKTCCLQNCPHSLSSNGGLKYTSGKINELCFATQQHVPGFRFHGTKSRAPAPDSETETQQSLVGTHGLPAAHWTAVLSSLLLSRNCWNLNGPAWIWWNNFIQFPQLHVGS